MSQDMIIVTPENAEIRLPLAGIFSRAGAFAYDLCLQIVGLIVIKIAVSFVADALFLWPYLWGISSFFYGFGLIFTMLWAVGYYVYFETFNHGQTPGKKVFSIRVVRSNGQELRFFNSFLRTILKIADFMPALFCAAVFSTVISENQQRIGDLLADTIVIREQND